MPLHPLSRKLLLPYGAQAEIARTAGVSKGYVSGVVSGSIAPQSKKARRVQVLVARKLKMRVAEVFPAAPAVPSHHAAA
jgi:predicted transcriptional regulator